MASSAWYRKARKLTGITRKKLPDRFAPDIVVMRKDRVLRRPLRKRFGRKLWRLLTKDIL